MNAHLGLIGAFLALFAPGKQPLAEPLPPGAVARFGDFQGRDGTGQHRRAACVPAHNLLVTAGNDSSVHVFELATGRRLRTILIDDSAAGPLALSPDGKLLAVEARGDIYLFDLATGKETARLRGHVSRIDSVAFSPDGQLLASVEGDQGIRVWEAKTGKQTRHITTPGVYQRFVEFTPDGKSLAVLADTNDHDLVRFWDVASGKEEKTLKTGMTTGSLVFSADGAAVAVAGDQLRVWDLKPEGPTQRFQIAYPNPKNHQRRVCKAVFSPDGKVVATGSAQSILLLDAATGKILRSIMVRPGPVNTDTYGTNMISLLAFAPDGKRLYSWCRNDRLRIWDPASGTELLQQQGHDAAVVSIIPSSRPGLVVSRDARGAFRLWEMSTGKKILLSEKVPQSQLLQLLATDGRWLVLGKEDRTVVVDALTGQEKLSLPKESFRHFVFSSNGRALVGIDAASQRLHLWPLEADNEPGSREGMPNKEIVLEAQGNVKFPHLSPNSFSADARLLAVATSSGDVQLLQPATRRIVKTYAVPEESSYTQAILSPDGSLLAATFQGGSIRIFDTTTHAERITFSAALLGENNSLAFSSDGNTLATGGEFPEVRLWEVATGQLRQTFKGHQDGVTAVAFSADGRHLLSGGQDWTAVVWDVLGPAGEPLPRDKDALLALWEELGNREAQPAWQAMARLIRDPDRAVPWLRERVRQVKLLGPKQIAQLIRDLDNDSFDIREKATVDLEKLGKEIEEDVKRALAANPTPEMKSRLERILEVIKEGAPPTEKTRMIRVLEVLERVGTPAAREQLTEMAKDPAGVWLPDRASAALRRLDRMGKKMTK